MQLVLVLHCHPHALLWQQTGAPTCKLFNRPLILSINSTMTRCRTGCFRGTRTCAFRQFICFCALSR